MKDRLQDVKSPEPDVGGVFERRFREKICVIAGKQDVLRVECVQSAGA